VKALTFQGVEKVRVDEVDPPVLLDDGDVIVRVEASAVCGSDLHVFHGRETGLDVGTILGHELVGDVVETSTTVQRLATGDRVVAPFSTSCGQCFYCGDGLTARCERGQLLGWVENGAGLPGVQAEYVRIPLADSTLVLAPDALPPELALLAGDILSTGLFAADLAEAGPGRAVAVIGCGPVGLMAIVAAREAGADPVLALDSIEERLELAERLGARPIDVASADPIWEVQSVTEGRGADAALEIVGSARATRLAIDLVRPGGTIAAVGVHTEATLAFAPGEAYDKNLTYRAGRCPARRYMRRALSIAESGRWPLEALFTHRMALADGARAYDLFARRAGRPPYRTLAVGAESRRGAGFARPACVSTRRSARDRDHSHPAARSRAKRRPPRRPAALCRARPPVT